MPQGPHLSRRQFARLATGMAALPALALPALAPLARAARAQSRQDTRMHVIDMANAPFFDRNDVARGLDDADACTRPNHVFLESLVNSGVDTVLRYYSDQNNAGLTCKNVTRRERDLLADHGLALAIVYQFEGRSKNRYTGQRAAQDGAFCLERARVIGQPDQSAIYFGVDSDTAANTDQGVLDYFREIRALFGGRYRVGIYAAGARCALIRNAGLADYFWVPEAPAWAGTRDFMNSGNWTVFQNKTNINNSWMTSGMGQTLHIDTDIVNPMAGNSIGAFDRDGSIRSYDPARLRAIADARHWVTEARLEVFDEPGSGPAGHICIARTVHVLEPGGEWAWVDTDEDGIADGYCRQSALSPLSAMPKWRRTNCKLVDI